MSKHGDIQRERVLHAIAELRRANGYSPTIREIGAEVGLSKTAVFNHLKTLRERGEVYSPRPGAGWRLSVLPVEE